MKILLAVDGSASSQAAVASVAARPWPTGSEIKILAVAELHIVQRVSRGRRASNVDEILAAVR